MLKKHSSEIKAKVALATTKGDQTVAELVQKYNFHANPISTWKKELLENAAMIFWSECSVVRPSPAKNSLVKFKPLPIKRQCELLNITCSN